MTKRNPPYALVKVERGLAFFAEDPAWQRFWLNLESLDWRSLAVVPAGDDSSIDLVHGLAAVAWQQRGASVIVADMRMVPLTALRAARDELRRRVEHGERVLIAMRSLAQSPTTSTIAREADKALVCVFAGQSSRAQVRSTIREIGIHRCLGSILIHSVIS